MKLLIGLVFISLIGSSVFAQDKGHGGDGIAIEARAVAKALVTVITEEQNRIPSFGLINLKEFTKVVDKVVIKTSSSAVKDHLGDEKTAINFFSEDGAPTILIHIAKYNELPSVTRQRLIFHEILGLIGLEKSNEYSISEKFTSEINRPTFGLCKAKYKKVTCIIGLKFDYTLRSVEGSYTCRRDYDLYNVGTLIPAKATFKYVSNGSKYGTTEGLHYKDEWLDFEVATPMMTGIPSQFKTNLRVSRDEFINMKGTCELSYR